jgi:TonB family protein
MIKTKLLWILLLFTFKLLAQSDTSIVHKDTAFYKFENGFLHSCQRDIAEGYSISAGTNPNIHLYTVNYLQSDNFMVAFEVYDKTFSNKENNVKSNLRIKNGKYEELYISGEKRLSCNYVENKLDGEFKVFYKNGTVKRAEQWQNGEWKNGACFDEDGNKIEYCSYQELAEFDGGLSELYKYIGQTLIYPKIAQRNGIEGKVILSFTIDTDGSITDIKIVKSINTFLDAEAYRIVKEMPNWKPGKFEGKLVKTEFSLPINFKLVN